MQLSLGAEREYACGMMCLIGRLHVCLSAGNAAQPDIGLSTQDLQRMAQVVAANLSVHSYFVDITNRCIPDGTATKSELAQVCKYTEQGNVLHHA